MGLKWLEFYFAESRHSILSNISFVSHLQHVTHEKKENKRKKGTRIVLTNAPLFLSTCVSFLVDKLLSHSKSFLFPLQILQSLSAQSLTSSGGSGSSTIGGDGGNSSGVSRSIVKDRSSIYSLALLLPLKLHTTHIKGSLEWKWSLSLWAGMICL